MPLKSVNTGKKSLFWHWSPRLTGLTKFSLIYLTAHAMTLKKMYIFINCDTREGEKKINDFIALL
jgi:hypothetical protein